MYTVQVKQFSGLHKYINGTLLSRLKVAIPQSDNKSFAYIQTTLIYQCLIKV